MTIDKAQLKALADSPRCGVRWPQFESVCGKTKDGKSTWQCGECARKEAAALRVELDKCFGLYRDADEHAVHWQCQERVKARWAKQKEEEVEALRAELAGLRTGYDAQNQVIAGLKAKNEALHKDSERLNWLTAQGAIEDPSQGDVRGYIDAAMAGEASHGE